MPVMRAPVRFPGSLSRGGAYGNGGRGANNLSRLGGNLSVMAARSTCTHKSPRERVVVVF